MACGGVLEPPGEWCLSMTNTSTLAVLTTFTGTSPHSDSMTISSEVASKEDDKPVEKALMPVPHSTAMRFISSLRESCYQVCLLAGDR